MAGTLRDLAGIQALMAQQQDTHPVSHPPFGLTGPQARLQDFDVFGTQDNLGGFGSPENNSLPLRSSVPGF